MKRFGVLFKKEFLYGAIMMKVMMYCFAIGYGALFGFLSRLSEYLYTSIIGMMPIVIAISGAPQVLQSISSDKQERTGEMVLTTGVSLQKYVLSKLISCIVHTVIAILLFYVVILLASGKMSTQGMGIETILYAILMGAVISIFYCCIAIMLRLSKPGHKLIIAAFLLVVAALAILVMVNSFVNISLLEGIPGYVAWLVLFLYGLLCMYIGMKFLAVRDFVAK